MTQASNLKTALLLLEQVMLQRKAVGFDTIALSESGLRQLRNLPLVLKKGGVKPDSVPARVAVPVVVPAPAPVAAQVAGPVAVPVADQSDLTDRQTSQPPAPAPKAHSYGDLAVKTEMRGRVEIIFPAGDSVREKLNNLFRLAKKCEICRGLGTLRDQLVFATGNPEASLMLVGEAPTSEDEEAKKPFSSPSGQKLNQILQAMGLKREDVYLSNILKYRPKIGDGRFQGQKNRKATPEELAVSLKFVRSEIEVIKPKVVVALGATVAEALLEQSGSMSQLRGKFFQVDGIPVSITYEPAYLLRLEGESDQEFARQEKRKVWEDALGVMEKLNMPISEKQRSFFSR